MTYNQYLAAPQGLNYLASDIMPWDDYVILRIDEDTSVAVYGQVSEDLTWESATVRTVVRGDYNTYYQVSEQELSDVNVNISNPYYAYGNVIGVSYDLPSTDVITSNIISGVCICLALYAVFNLVWRLKRGIVH